jgi:hypothetical protein
VARRDRRVYRRPLSERSWLAWPDPGERCQRGARSGTPDEVWHRCRASASPPPPWSHHTGVPLLEAPTDDLDVNTLRALEDGLEQFVGCVVVISYDRWLLGRTATHILAFEGESKVTFFDGNLSKHEEWRKEALGDAATRPHRITCRKLTR